MAARLTETDRYVRGDRRLAHAIETLAVAAVVVIGTAAGLAASGMWPWLGIGFRVVAGLGAALAMAWLLIVRGER
jgi:hypothetical protein